MTEILSLKVLQGAVSENAAAFRCRTELQPAGGEGDKVFPPTYEGGKYAIEKRRLPGEAEPVDCVLLDSVQSQANRMELALLDAWERQQISLPVIVVDFAGNKMPKVLRITSLEAPHRIADALLRDSLHNGQPFRKSDVGKRLDEVDNRNATALFEVCPTALVWGMWDSTGPKGGLGVKFQRAIVSEIVGIGASVGKKTSSRRDPAEIEKNAGPIFRRSDGGWTLDPDQANIDGDIEKKPKVKVLLYGKSGKKEVWHEMSVLMAKDGGRTLNMDNAESRIEPKFQFRLAEKADSWIDASELSKDIPEAGRPSVANHGNILPTIADGSVTIVKAVQTTVISLPAMRRLRFPLDGKHTPAADDAARTVLAALGLCAATLTREQGCDLRSRCLLIPTSKIEWELLDKPGDDPKPFTLTGEDAIKLFMEAVAIAKKAGLPWMEKELKLTPSPELVALVKKSQELSVATVGAEEGDE